jgi:exodeoxyribonuclease VII large subunit
VIQVITRRWPLVELVIVPVAVQGEGAAAEIAEGLRQAARLPRVDVIITGRGGGSLEDLWAFNEELVARAIAASPIPVVTAVGHEIDVTIADLAADRRALTPSEAGELVVPLLSDIQQVLASARQRMISALQHRARQARHTLDGLAARRCFARPAERLHDLASRLDELESRLKSALRRQADTAKHRLSGLAATLHALSPLAVLERGYSLTHKFPSGEVVRSASELHLGDRVQTRLSQGTVVSLVEELDCGPETG